MNKKIILLSIAVIIILILIIIGGIVYYKFMEWNNQSSDDYKKTLSLAVDNNDYSLCKNIPLSDWFASPRADCYWRIAENTGDTSLCGEILNTNLSGSNGGSLFADISFCYGQVVSKYKDVKICDEFRDKKDYYFEKIFGDKYNNTEWATSFYNYVLECYETLALVTKDLTVCDHLEGETYKKECRNWVETVERTNK